VEDGRDRQGRLRPADRLEHRHRSGQAVRQPRHREKRRLDLERNERASRSHRGFNRLDSTVLKACGGRVLAKEGADGLLGLSIEHPEFPDGWAWW
jgi:hypothetical protein